MNVGGTPANLRPPFRPGNTAPRRSADVNKAITRARKYSPQAVEVAASIMLDPEQPTKYRLKAVETILATGLPKNPEALALAVGGGVEWLELRFVDPQGPTETHRIELQPSVGESMGQTIDAEPETSDIKDLSDE